MPSLNYHTDVDPASPSTANTLIHRPPEYTNKKGVGMQRWSYQHCSLNCAEQSLWAGMQWGGVGGGWRASKLLWGLIPSDEINVSKRGPSSWNQGACRPKGFFRCLRSSFDGKCTLCNLCEKKQFRWNFICDDLIPSAYVTVSLYWLPQEHIDHRHGCGSVSLGHSIPLITRPVKQRYCPFQACCTSANTENRSLK